MKKNSTILLHFFMRFFVFLVAVVLLSGCTHKISPTESNNLTIPKKPERVSADELIVQVIENDEDRNEKGVYLVNPVTEEVVQLTHPHYQLAGLYGQNLVLFEKNLKKYYRYDFRSKEYVPLNFPALKEEGNTYQILYIDSTPISGGDKIFLNVFTYDSSDEVSDFYGDRVPRGRKGYLYSFSQNLFEEAHDIEKAKELLGDKLDSSGGFNLLGFDQRKNLAFFQFSGEGIGCGDIVVVDIVHNTIVQQIRENGWQGGIVAGCFYINPTLDFGFYVESKNDKVIATLVSLSDITRSLFTFDLTNTMDKYDYGRNIALDIDSMEWLNENERIAIGFTDRIAILDLKNSKLEIIYRDSTLGQSYMHWDRSVIRSDGENVIAFVDYYSARYNKCNAWSQRNCPSSEKSDDRYRIIVHNLSDGLQKVLLDDDLSKRVIGWIDL